MRKENGMTLQACVICSTWSQIYYLKMYRNGYALDSTALKR